MKNKKRKAFTLVELLAVIVILAVILVIAIPQIITVIKSARLSSIKDSAMLIAEQAEKDYLSQQVLNKDYNSTSIPCSDVAKLNDDYDSCKITYINNGIAMIKLKGKDGGKFSGITCKGTKDNITCEKYEHPVNECISSGELVNNKEYVNGQYKYTYSSSNDGWSMILVDKDSTNPVTTKMCTSIDGKPIVLMNSLFANSKTTSIDLSSFDTSNVTQMYCMFCDVNVPDLDLSNLDMSSVSGTGGLFQNVTTNTIDLSGVNFGNATGLGGMFNNTNASLLDLSNAKFDSATSLGGAFGGSNVDTLDLSNASFSSANGVAGMFSNVTINLINLSNSNFSNTTSLIGMFSGNIGTIDFSNMRLGNISSSSSMFSNATVNTIDFRQRDLSVISDASDIFKNANITTCLVKTIQDAKKLNKSSNKPSTFTCSANTIPEWLYVFGTIRREVVSYEIDEENCPTSKWQTSLSSSQEATYCSGELTIGSYGRQYSLSDDINSGNGLIMEKLGVIKNVVYGEWGDGIEEDYRNLKDSNNNQRPVFIKFNNDLSELYLCTMYDSTKANGFGTEAHCLLSPGAYDTRNETNSQWNQIKALFGDSDGSQNICTDNGYEISCHSNKNEVGFRWSCFANGNSGLSKCNLWENNGSGGGHQVAGCTIFRDLAMECY